jgi:uncharacterized membrane protein
MPIQNLNKKEMNFANAVLIGFSLLHLFIVLLNHFYFRTFAYYYGVYNFAFFDYAHLGNHPIPLLFDTSNSTFLQDHFSLLFIFLSPLYWVFNFFAGTYLLLIIQWAAIVYGGWATFKLILYKSLSLKMSLAALTCYFFFYSRFSAYHADCNLAIIGSALIPVFLYFFSTKKIKSLIAVFFVLLITREDFSLWLSFICLFLLIENRKNKQQFKLAIVLMLVSSLFFMIIFKWIIPSLETETVKFALFNYSALGSTPMQAFTFIVQHPLNAIKLLFVNHLQNPEYDWHKFKYYAVFGLSGGLLLFYKPQYLICLIPIITKKMYNDDWLRWTYETYYGIETASILPALVFMVIADFKSNLCRMIFSGTVVFSLLLTSYFCFLSDRQPFVFSKYQFFKPIFYVEDYPAKQVHHLLSQIPDNAAVSASSRLLPHLANREKIYYFTEIHDAQFVCISLDGDTWPYSKAEYQQSIWKMLKNNLWKAKFAVGNIVVFKKKSSIIN